MKKKNSYLPIICFTTAWILSNIMCVFVSCKWMKHMQNKANSAPPEVTLVYSIPFLIVILVLLLIGIKRKRGDI